MKFNDIKITDTIKYVGVNSHDVDLFEGQYIVPNGMAYNSYVILDDKIAITDTVDKPKCEEWLNNIEDVLGDKTPDYLIVHHMEPDHSSNIMALVEKYPKIQIVGNSKTFAMMNQFFNSDTKINKIEASENFVLNLGQHKLTFLMAPMVHWPEVMVSYDEYDKVLFSADGFGKFGALDIDEAWDCEARRYYFNIVGKYGAQVQALLKKTANLDIKIICPLHGPILSEDLSHYIGLYDTWSKYEAETNGVYIAYASVYGNTKHAAETLGKMLEEKGVKVSIADLSREDWAEAVEDAFRYNRLVVASPTYDGGIFTSVHEFLEHLKAKTYRNRTVGIIENGSWAPMAGKKIKEAFESMKNIEIIDPIVTIKSAVNPENIQQLKQLADTLA